MKNIFKRFTSDNSGATAIEYGLIAALMSVALIAAFGHLQTGLTNAFTNISSNLETKTAVKN